MSSADPVTLAGVPFHPQEAHHCGPSSLLSQLEASGVTAEYDAVVERVFVPGLEGSLQVEMLATARSFGRIAYTLPPEPQAVLAEVEAGRPVLVLLNLRLPQKPVWHYALVVGLDPRRNDLLLHSGVEASSRQRAAPWLRRWNWAGRWAMVLLEPGEWPAVADRERLLGALAAFEEVAEPAAAERAWATAVEQWPREPIVWLGLGNTAHRQGNRERAVEAFRRALEVEPGHLPARLNLAQSLGELGRPCEAYRVMGSPPPPDHPLTGAFAALETTLHGECVPP